MKKNIPIKTKGELSIMKEGGKRLSQIKDALFYMVKEGVSAFEIDKKAEELMLKAGGYPSFKMVAGYNWATCINVNEGVVHGIPKRGVIFKEGDLVSVDLGLFYKGLHTDTSFSKIVGRGNEFLYSFVEAGKKALKNAVLKCLPGNRIYDISEAIESTLKESGFRPTSYLTGHGVGKELHEEPMIPGVVNWSKRSDTAEIKPGMALALEVIYLSGNDELLVEEDGWTISTADGKIAGLFEDTVIVTSNGSELIT